MVRPYLFTKGAADDLSAIIRHTHQKWGASQCQAYVAQLESKAVALATGQGVFKELGFIHPQLRMTKSGRHFIFCLYRSDAPSLILAILHERMDIAERIKNRLS